MPRARIATLVVVGCFALFLLLLSAKLVGLATWSWGWVWAPVWGPLLGLGLAVAWGWLGYFVRQQLRR
jgi:CHASE2 domain-containing sensor protein